MASVASVATNGTRIFCVMIGYYIQANGIIMRDDRNIIKTSLGLETDTTIVHF